MIEDGLATDDDAEFERRRAAWEKQLRFPHMEAELDWLRAMQDAMVDAGLKLTGFKRNCILLNFGSAGLASWMLLIRDAQPDFFWMAVILFANVATIGAYLTVAIALTSQRSALSRVNERARIIDSRVFGEMSVGSTIEKRIW